MAVTVVSRQRSRCPVCRTEGRDLSSRWSLRECESCAHVWAGEGRPEIDNALYESADYAEWRTESPALIARQRAVARRRSAVVLEHIGDSGRALELGCSTGESAADLVRNGWTVDGLDLSAAAIDVARARHESLGAGARFGVGAAPEEAGFGDEPYDLVMGFHVVEHIEDLSDVMAGARRWLRPGGHLYLRVPNWSSWARRVFRDRWPNNMPEHLHQFSARSMSHWLESNGFEVTLLTTRGEPREWIGGVRRLLSKDWNTSETMPTTGARAQQLSEVLDRLGRPFFAVAERFDAGGELIVIARRES